MSSLELCCCIKLEQQDCFKLLNLKRLTILALVSVGAIRHVGSHCRQGAAGPSKQVKMRTLVQERYGSCSMVRNQSRDAAISQLAELPRLTYPELLIASMKHCSSCPAYVMIHIRPGKDKPFKLHEASD